MKNNKLLIGLVILVLLFLFMKPSSQLKGASAGLTATRTFDKTTVAPGSLVTATYVPLTKNYFGLIETVPTGWTADKTISPDGKLRTSADGANIVVKWTAPSTPGQYAFTGTYFVNPDETYTLFATDTITVDNSAPTCSGSCKSDACSTYNSCSAGTGTCASGNCCSGTCTVPTETVYWCLTNNQCISGTTTGASCYTTQIECQTHITACTPSCTCAANTCTGSTCSNGCSETCPGTKSCTCTADSSCAANTCTGQSCADSCGNSYPGTKTCTTQTCTAAGFYECSTSKTCNSLKSSYSASSGVCCASEANCVASTTTQTCSQIHSCQFYQECNTDETGCKTAGWVVPAMIGLAFLVVVPPLLRG